MKYLPRESHRCKIKAREGLNIKKAATRMGFELFSALQTDLILSWTVLEYLCRLENSEFSFLIS